jgi:pSer/pThr/pTyr-binding forkhead associated (FHA) protein
MNSTTVRITISISAPDKDDSVNLVGQEFIFGRSPTSTVHINDPGYSRSHFKIFLHDDALWISDVGSSNGTFLNDERIGSQNPLELGVDDVISVPNSESIITISSIDFEDEEDTEKTIAINLQDLNFQSESSEYSDLSDQIYEAARMKVEQIIQDANSKSEEILAHADQEFARKKAEAQQEADKIILEKQQKADAQLDKFIIDSKNAIQKELQAEKEQQADAIKSALIADRKKMLKKLEEEAAILAQENEQRKRELQQGIVILEKQLVGKKEDYQKIESLFEEKLKKANEDLDQKIKGKRKELERIELNYHEEKSKLIEQVEKEMADHRAELQLELGTLETKISSKAKELVRLDHDYKKKQEKFMAQAESDAQIKKEEIQFLLNEMDDRLSSKKSELVKLEQAHESLKANQFKLLEAQFEKKKMEIEEQLTEYERKISAAQKEFSGLFESYEFKKQEQVALLDGLKNQKQQIQHEIKDLEARLVKSKKDTDDQVEANTKLLQTLQVDIEKYKKGRSEVEAVYSKLNQEYIELQKNVVEAKKLTLAEETLLKEKRQTLQTLETETKKLSTQKESMIPKLATLNAELSALNQRIEVSSLAVANIQNDHNKEVAALKATFLQNKAALDEEMHKLKEAEEKRLQNLTRQELNQINKIKEDSLRLVLELEDSITKELSNSTSKVFANTIGVTKFKEIAPDYEKSIRTSLQAGVLKLLQNELTTPDPSKKSLSSNPNIWKPVTISVIASALIFGLLPHIYRQVQDQNDPIRKQLEEQARLAAIVPARKFTPTKVSTLGSTFVNSVIYTEGFCEIYAQENFRSELMKKGSAYLYKQWQIDEEKAIQSYAMIFSMIDLLREKTGKIDPDNEAKDIAKMAQLEKETLKKLEKILGNEVRLDAALKFQNRYYQEYVAQRGIASGSKEDDKEKEGKIE